ncbi:MAG: hypothetical protein ABGX71_05135 [Methyloprofundus sp.]
MNRVWLAGFFSLSFQVCAQEYTTYDGAAETLFAPCIEVLRDGEASGEGGSSPVRLRLEQRFIKVILFIFHGY